MKRIQESELIINPDGSIYHLNLKPEDISDTILLVGDPGRVDLISSYFDEIECRISNREFITVTGYVGDKRISVISSGIGTGNIDIVINELDALVNIDFASRTIKEERGSLNLIRLGTSGALQQDVEVDSLVGGSYGLGIDGLLWFYNAAEVIDHDISDAFAKSAAFPKNLAKPYIVKGSDKLSNIFSDEIRFGITATSGGFYAPQGRELRLKPLMPDLQQRLQNFDYQGIKILNLEMETSAIYGLGGLLGHECITICAVIANRIRMEFSKDYKRTVRKMIEMVLGKINEL